MESLSGRWNEMSREKGADRVVYFLHSSVLFPRLISTIARGRNVEHWYALTFSFTFISLLFHSSFGTGNNTCRYTRYSVADTSRMYNIHSRIVYTCISMKNDSGVYQQILFTNFSNLRKKKKRIKRSSIDETLTKIASNSQPRKDYKSYNCISFV